MGIDFGDRRIGIAMSDEMGWTAQGVKHILRKNLDHDLKEIENILQEYGNVATIVIGMPYNMDGSEGERVKITRDFIKQLQLKFNLPVVEIDERWSSREAENILISADVSRKKRKDSIDQIAAGLILQTFLDQNKK